MGHFTPLYLSLPFSLWRKSGFIIKKKQSTGDCDHCWNSFIQHCSDRKCIVDSSFEKLLKQKKDLQWENWEHDQQNAPRIEAEVSGKKVCFPRLTEQKIATLARTIQVSLKSCLQNNAFIFWLDWILRLPEYNKQDEVPTEVAKWSAKDWSHITSMNRLFLNVDAGNRTYMYVAQWLAQALTPVAESRKDSTRGGQKNSTCKNVRVCLQHLSQQGKVSIVSLEPIITRNTKYNTSAMCNQKKHCGSKQRRSPLN